MSNVKITEDLALDIPDGIVQFVCGNVNDFIQNYAYNMPDKFRTPKDTVLMRIQRDFEERGRDYVLAVCYVGYFLRYRPMDYYEFTYGILPDNYMEMLDTIGKFKELQKGYEDIKVLITLALLSDEEIRAVHSHVPAWQHA